VFVCRTFVIPTKLPRPSFRRREERIRMSPVLVTPVQNDGFSSSRGKALRQKEPNHDRYDHRTSPAQGLLAAWLL
jgi:hypothetical protein